MRSPIFAALALLVVGCSGERRRAPLPRCGAACSPADAALNIESSSPADAADADSDPMPRVMLASSLGLRRRCLVLRLVEPTWGWFGQALRWIRMGRADFAIEDIFFYNTGGRYDVAQRTWSPTSTVGAPVPRYMPIAVWTGSEMIVWGGTTMIDSVNDGGRYDRQPTRGNPCRRSAGSPTRNAWPECGQGRRCWSSTESMGPFMIRRTTPGRRSLIRPHRPPE